MARYEVIESKVWVRDDGAKASIYGACPWVSELERPRWKIVTRGYTVQDNARGTVGLGRKPFDNYDDALAVVNKLNADYAGKAAA